MSEGENSIVQLDQGIGTGSTLGLEVLKKQGRTEP